MLTGRCLCGAVSYTVEGHFLYAGYCHCSQCRRTSGSAFTAFAAIREDALCVTAGQESISTYAKSTDNIRSFCNVCGSNLFSLKPASGLVHVQMGTLVEAPGVFPMTHAFVGSNASWHQITDVFPQFQKDAPRKALAR